MDPDPGGNKFQIKTDPNFGTTPENILEANSCFVKIVGFKIIIYLPFTYLYLVLILKIPFCKWKVKFVGQGNFVPLLYNEIY